LVARVGDPVTNHSQCKAALVLAGGVGLGAYQAGAYEALHREGSNMVCWIAGSSIGAVNAALIAGTSAGRRLDALREFWSGGNMLSLTPGASGYLGHAENWLSVLQSRLFGASNLFRPRFPGGPLQPFRSLYDLAPLRDCLAKMVDFDRLNSGETRVSVATTDIETGELVIFDNRLGQKIAIDHLLASCGFLPEFAPVEIDGRLLGDGGLCANAPVEALLKRDEADGELRTFVIDLFARDGKRPRSLEDALARKNDLLFGNQTLRRLEAYVEAGRIGPVLHLSYRAPEEEAGPEKMFDLSRRTIMRRWAAGDRDMQHALEAVCSNPARKSLTVIRSPSPAGGL
jgi:NTE family protein